MATQTKVKTKTAFTPGPWYDQNAWGERINIREEASDYVLAVVDDGGHVDPAFSLDWEVMQANGRLMAAAPRMIAALEAALAVHGDGYSWGADAKEAIKQARGE